MRRCLDCLRLFALVALLAGCAGTAIGWTAPGSTPTPERAASTAGVASTAASGATATTRASATTALAAPTSGVDVWASLQQRALHLPTLSDREACPTTPWQHAGELARGLGFDQSYLAFGKGPIYPIIYNFSPRADALPVRALYADGGVATKDRDKVLWIARPDYKGPALIRGRQLGGLAVLQFGPSDAGAPATELRFAAATGVSSGDTALGWRDRPSYVVIPGPGCYAFQLDGLNFSDVIVFDVAG